MRVWLFMKIIKSVSGVIMTLGNQDIIMSYKICLKSLRKLEFGKVYGWKDILKMRVEILVKDRDQDLQFNRFCFSYVVLRLNVFLIIRFASAISTIIFTMVFGQQTHSHGGGRSESHPQRFQMHGSGVCPRQQHLKKLTVKSKLTTIDIDKERRSK